MREIVECPVCGHDSQRTYRCPECGKDLTGETTTSGREEVAR
jgi:primosomal protein N'